MLQSDWGWTVVIDLFMSGFGGCLFVATAIGFLLAKDSFAKVARVGAWVSFSAVLVGVLFLRRDSLPGKIRGQLHRQKASQNG